MAGVVLSSKHRSSVRGRFAYLTISDPFGIYETMIFDEELITSSRDLLEDGSIVAIECLIRKDVGGARILIKGVSRLEDYIKNVKPSDKDFFDIKKIKTKKNNFERNEKNNHNNSIKLPSASSSQGTAKSSQFKELKKGNEIESGENLSEKINHQIKILRLIITDKSVISPLKIMLQQNIDANQNEQITQIYLIAKNANKSMIFSLPKIYIIKEIDIIRFKNFNKNLQLEFELI
jgi:hypothetical protein